MKNCLQILFLLLLANVAKTQALVSADSVALVPKPRSLQAFDAFYTLPASVKLYVGSSEERQIGSFLRDYLQQIGCQSSFTSDKQAATIRLTVGDKTIAPEGYRLVVNKRGLSVEAGDGAGLFYGVQTVQQLLPTTRRQAIRLRYVTIADQPAFQWRGCMLDVGRHMFPVSFIKKYIDLLAMYKLNTFHWHLTDDQGWRIEIKKYPKLTQISAFRKETFVGSKRQYKSPADWQYDGTPYGGFYTQEEVREIVAYAQKRYITIVPEIEMPGHSVAVLAAYPELACKPGPYEVFTRWGVSEDIVCPSEQTIAFFQDVLTEVCALFPGPYVHIGGDEAPKVRWKESPLVADLMKKEGIAEVEQVQGWFNRRIETFLKQKGKKLVGWDEILEDGITSSATVMSWRGVKGGIEAAKHGNNVVMTPSTHLYFDYGQNPVPFGPYEPLAICCYLPMQTVYSYNPIPEELTAGQHKFILGAQANLWTECVTTPQKAEYMLFPRLMALAEVAWTPNAAKSYPDFLRRLGRQFAKLDARDVHYRIPEPMGLDSASIQREGDSAIITLRSLVPNARITYTLDGTLPGETSLPYTKPIRVPIGKPRTIKAVTITPTGRVSIPAEGVVK